MQEAFIVIYVSGSCRSVLPIFATKCELYTIGQAKERPAITENLLVFPSP
jgi:hypothetical protein